MSSGKVCELRLKGGTDRVTLLTLASNRKIQISIVNEIIIDKQSHGNAIVGSGIGSQSVPKSHLYSSLDEPHLSKPLDRHVGCSSPIGSAPSPVLYNTRTHTHTEAEQLNVVWSTKVQNILDSKREREKSLEK